MNKFIVVAVRDRAVDAFMQPWFAPSLGAAIRAFSDEVNRAASDNALNRHPEDYDLYSLGEWNSANGKFDSGDPRQIAVGKEVLVKG